MIIGEFSDVVPMSVKMGAAAFDGRDQLGELEEESVREGLVDDGPNALRGLKFGGVGGQEHEMNALGNLQVLCGVPTRPVDHEYGAFQRPNPLRFTVSPVEGRTKEKRYAHLYERRDEAVGRLPRGAQTRRYVGIRPNRPSSSAQSWTSAVGNSRTTSRTRLASPPF